MASGSAAAPSSLSVAVYPYVPRKQQFIDELSARWASVHPEIALEFVDWDCYDSDPPADLDVFVFDAIYLDDFVTEGHLARLDASEVEGAEDFLAYAREGVQATDGQGGWWALPQLGCADILFYREGDEALAKAEDFAAIEAALGSCTYAEDTPPEGVGLLLDASGGTTNACRYVEAGQDLAHAYTPAPALPAADALVQANLDLLRAEIGLSSLAEARKDYGQAYGRAASFDTGVGRAMVGFTESMWAMKEHRDAVDFRVMPLDGEPGVDLFYADLVGVNARIPANERPAALELANLMTSAAYISAVFGPSADDPSPQYLMPARTSVFDELGGTFPIYAEMRAMVEAADPHLFRLGPGARDWLEDTKSAIKAAVYADPVCPAK